MVLLIIKQNPSQAYNEKIQTRSWEYYRNLSEDEKN